MSSTTQSPEEPGTLNTPDGRNPAVRVIWVIDDGDDTPRLASAYPL